MKSYKSIIVFLFLLFSSSCFALSMSNHVVEHFKKNICQCSQDALAISGEYKNNGYYVNLKDGKIKGYSFNNVVVKFEGLDEKKRNDLLKSRVGFDDLKNNCTIKGAGDIKPFEIQQVINNEIDRSSTARRIFDKALFSFDNDYVNVNGSINLKRVPGNPFALLSNDNFVPFNAKVTAVIEGTIINISIIELNINGEEATPELKQVFLNWLNPLWDFSKLGFNCEIKEYKITPNGLRIVFTVF